MAWPNPWPLDDHVHRWRRADRPVFGKFNPNVAYVNVMHPDSGNHTMAQITASEFQKQKPTP